jgi:hypothetical protein
MIDRLPQTALQRRVPKCIVDHLSPRSPESPLLDSIMSAHVKHWSWAYFITDGQLFRNNNSYKNAWCITCLNHHKEQLRQADVVSAAISGSSSGRTDAERETQGCY